MKNGWPIVKLGEVLGHRKEFIQIDGLAEYKRCRVQLHTKGIVLRDIIEGAAIKTKSQQVCRAGEFLVAEIDAKVGGFGIVPDDLDGAIVSSHYFLFTIYDARLNRSFLGYFIRTPAFREQVGARGSTNYAAIRPSHVLNYEIPLPPLEEQRRIVAKIEQLAAKIDEARDLQQKSVAQSAVLLSAASDARLSTKKWAWRTVEDACEALIDYRGRTPPFADAGIPHITSANVKDGKIDWATSKFVTEQTYMRYMTRGVPMRGDVIFTMEAPLGDAAALKDNRQFSLAQRTLLLRGRTGLIEGEYLARAMTTPTVRDVIYAQATGTTVKGIASKRLKKIQIPVPPLDEQRRIVTYLDGLEEKVNRLRALQEKTAAELDALLPAVLDKAFKGEL